MNFRALLAAPLAAVVVTSNATELRMPSGWAFIAPPTDYEAGVDARMDEAGRHTLTVKSIGTRSARNFGAVEQAVSGHAGRRVRFSGQAKASGVDAWAGLIAGRGFFPLNHMMQGDAEARNYRPLGASACPQWCDVSVVIELPADSDDLGFVDVGVALVGNGQVWARNLKLEVVGQDVPLTTTYVGIDPMVERAARHQVVRERAIQMPPPRNLTLE